MCPLDTCLDPSRKKKYGQKTKKIFFLIKILNPYLSIEHFFLDWLRWLYMSSRITSAQTKAMTSLDPPPLSNTTAIDWMSTYSQNLELQTYMRDDLQTTFCFLRVPECADRSAHSMCILDVRGTLSVCLSIFWFVFFQFSLEPTARLSRFCPFRNKIGSTHSSRLFTYVHFRYFSYAARGYYLAPISNIVQRFSSRHTVAISHQVFLLQQYMRLFTYLCSGSSFGPGVGLAASTDFSNVHFVRLSPTHTRPASSLFT